jgi:hypothetical protein
MPIKRVVREEDLVEPRTDESVAHGESIAHEEVDVSEWTRTSGIQARDLWPLEKNELSIAAGPHALEERDCGEHAECRRSFFEKKGWRYRFAEATQPMSG